MSSYKFTSNSKGDELYIAEGEYAFFVQPDLADQPGGDTVAFFSDPIGPELARRWEDLKGQIREFAEFIRAEGRDNSTGDCMEQMLGPVLR